MGDIGSQCKCAPAGNYFDLQWGFLNSYTASWPSDVQPGPTPSSWTNSYIASPIGAMLVNDTVERYFVWSPTETDDGPVYFGHISFIGSNFSAENGEYRGDWTANLRALTQRADAEVKDTNSQQIYDYTHANLAYLLPRNAGEYWAFIRNDSEPGGSRTWLGRVTASGAIGLFQAGTQGVQTNWGAGTVQELYSNLRPTALRGAPPNQWNESTLYYPGSLYPHVGSTASGLTDNSFDGGDLSRITMACFVGAGTKQWQYWAFRATRSREYFTNFFTDVTTSDWFPGEPGYALRLDTQETTGPPPNSFVFRISSNPRYQLFAINEMEALPSGQPSAVAIEIPADPEVGKFAEYYPRGLVTTHEQPVTTVHGVSFVSESLGLWSYGPVAHHARRSTIGPGSHTGQRFAGTPQYTWAESYHVIPSGPEVQQTQVAINPTTEQPTALPPNSGTLRDSLNSLIVDEHITDANAIGVAIAHGALSGVTAALTMNTQTFEPGSFPAENVGTSWDYVEQADLTVNVTNQPLRLWVNNTSRDSVGGDIHYAPEAGGIRKVFDVVQSGNKYVYGSQLLSRNANYENVLTTYNRAFYGSGSVKAVTVYLWRDFDDPDGINFGYDLLFLSSANTIDAVFRFDQQPDTILTSDQAVYIDFGDPNTPPVRINRDGTYPVTGTPFNRWESNIPPANNRPFFNARPSRFTSVASATRIPDPLPASELTALATPFVLPDP